MLSHSSRCLYALPMAAIGMINFLFEVYLLKFATDVLLLAPAVMGTIFSISRIWDAVADMGRALKAFIHVKHTSRFSTGWQRQVSGCDDNHDERCKCMGMDVIRARAPESRLYR